MIDWSEDYQPSKNRRVEERDKCRRLVRSGRKGPDRGMLAHASIADLMPEGTIWRKRPSKGPFSPRFSFTRGFAKIGSLVG